MSMGQVYPLCCVFNTEDEAILANNRITEAIRINQNPNTLPWSTPEQRVTDGKWFFQQPDYFEDAISLEGDITYTVEEFVLNWRKQEEFLI